MHRVFFVLLILFILNPVSVMYSSEPDDEPLKIALIASATGRDAYTQQPIIIALRDAITVVNNKGGVKGKRLVLIEYDNRSLSTEAFKMAEDAVKEGVCAIIGGLFSSQALAIAPVAEKARIPFITPTATHPDVTNGKYTFRVNITDINQANLLAGFAFTGMNSQRAAVITDLGQVYSTMLGREFTNAFERLGGQVVYQGGYVSGQLDFSKIIAGIPTSKADIIFLPGYPRESALFIRQTRQMGIPTPFLGSDTWNKTMYEYAGTHLEGCFFSGVWHRDLDSKGNAAFVRRYEKLYGKIQSEAVALAHDTVSLLVQAIERAHDSSPQAIYEALSTTKNFEGLTGTFSYENGPDPRKEGLILQFGMQSIHVHQKAL